MAARRLALYTAAKGTMSPQVGNFLLRHNVPLTTLTAKDIAGGGLAACPAVLIPGGGPPALAAKAVKALKSFVEGGGGYVGICAGAKFASKTKTGLLDFESRDVRGVGTHAVCLLRRHPITKGYRLYSGRHLQNPGTERVRIFRMNGSFMVPGSKVEVIASYDDQGTLAAILAGRCGKGRVAVFSPHPEIETPPLQQGEWPQCQDPAQLLINAISYVSHGKIKPLVET